MLIPEAGTALSSEFKGFLNELNEVSLKTLQEGAIPVRKKTVEMFKTRPPACEDTFMKSMTMQPSRGGEYIDAVVLFTPDMHLLKIMDNSESDASSSFEQSYTKGFTFTATQEFALGWKFHADFIFAKSEFEIKVTLTFCESWTKSETETITINVGPRNRAYIYQGIVEASILRFDAKKLSFYYLNGGQTGQYETEIIKTTKDPIV